MRNELSWALSKGDDVIPLIVASKVKNFMDSAGAINVDLSEKDIKKIEDAVPQNKIAGASFYKMIFENGEVVKG